MHYAQYPSIPRTLSSIPLWITKTPLDKGAVERKLKQKTIPQALVLVSVRA